MEDKELEEIIRISCLSFHNDVVNNRWERTYSIELGEQAYVNGRDLYVNGSDYHRTKLIKEQGKELEDLYEIYRPNPKRPNEAYDYLGINPCYKHKLKPKRLKQQGK